MRKSSLLAWWLLLCSLGVDAQGQHHTVGLQSRPGGTLYVEAVLAGQVPVNLLVDTGASMLTVNRDTFRQISQHTKLQYSHDLGFRNANGKIHVVKVYLLPKLTLGDNCQLNDVEVAVMAGGNNILGMNALSQFAPIGLSVQPPALELSNCDDALLARQSMPQ